MAANITDVLNRLEQLESLLQTVEDGDGILTVANGTQIWLILSGVLVFFMHAGFTMLETGSVQHKNAVNILFKNVGTISIGFIFYFLLGYGFAYGTENLEFDAEGNPVPDSGTFRFIGNGNFANDGLGNQDIHLWFFQAVFAATAATIVSGAVAGRVALPAYFAAAIFLVSFVYPVVTHWVWQTGGWLSAFQFSDQENKVLFEEDGCGLIDYAGSGVVHMTGGIAAFWGAVALGPRLGRFQSGVAVPIPPHSVTLQALGVFILWFGWYGFNAGSTLLFDGPNAAKAAVTTSLSPSTSVLTATVYSKLVLGHYDIFLSLNAVLAGLVSITAGCTVVEDWAAIVIGFVGAFVYIGASKLMILVGIDDPVDAIAVHGFAGMWGVLAVGIFADPFYIEQAYSKKCSGWNDGFQFATQLVGLLAIFAWVTLMMAPFFFLLKVAGVLRVSAEVEQSGLDYSEHGGTKAFSADDPESVPAKTDNAQTNESEIRGEEGKTLNQA